MTRWGGDYEAPKRAFLLRDPIEEFVASAIRNDVGEVNLQNPHSLRFDELSRDDWEELRSILNILEPFQACSLRLQGKCKNGSLSEILPAMDELLSHLEEAKELYADAHLHGDHLRGSIKRKLWPMQHFPPGVTVPPLRGYLHSDGNAPA